MLTQLSEELPSVVDVNHVVLTCPTKARCAVQGYNMGNLANG